MKRLLIATSILAALPAFAGSSGVNTGSSMTTGPVSNPYSLSSAAHNPAMGSLVVRKGENTRFSFGAMAFNVEYGQVDGFVDDLEELTDILDDPNATDDSTQEVLDRFNDVLVTFGEEGYVKGNFELHIPLMPFYIQSQTLGGTVAFDLSVAAQGGLRVLDDTLEFDPSGNYSTATSIYIKAATEMTFSASYSRPVYSNSFGTLYAGGSLNFINLELSKQILPLDTLDGDEIDTLLEDKYDDNLVETSDMSVDLGLVWDAKHYRIGLTMDNINEPEFAYGVLGQDCSRFAENTDERTTCEAEAYFTQGLGRVAAEEVHVRHAMARIDGVVKLTERLQLSGAYDLAEYDDVIGDANQWYHVSASYDADSSIIPSIRVGYQENLAGSKTSSLNAGATFFGLVNFDLQYGLDTVVVDGDELPRTLGFSLSVDERF